MQRVYMGRKKIVTTETCEAVDETSNSDEVQDTKELEPVKPAKKRVTKKDKVATVGEEVPTTAKKRGRKTKDIPPVTDSDTRNENVILQLSINPNNAEMTGNNFEKTFYKYEPNIAEPNAYDQYDNNEFSSQPFIITKGEEDETLMVCSNFPKATKKKTQQSQITAFAGIAPVIEKTVDKKNHRVYEHLSEFVAREDWPISTNTVCFWCCHAFHNTPYGVPNKYVNGKFHVFGCFCSLECTTAYNFYSVETKHDVWESYNLINLLARKISYSDTVKIAPPRHVLKMFGGYMEIDDYRNYCKTSKIINTHAFPMVAMIQQLEEINDNDQYSNRKNMFIPIDKQKLFLLESKVKLERTKPMFANKNTLDHTMKLRIDED